MKYIFYYLDELVRIEARHAFDIRALGTDHANHWDIKDRAKFHEGAFEEEGYIWRFSDLLLHEFDVILKYNPAPGDICDDLDVA